MANERMYPILPCRELDEAIAFYEALGFARTYRQLRPNPYAFVAREDMHVHLFGMPGFDPEQSYGSVCVVVPDPDALYHSFADGLRRKFGKLPVAGAASLGGMLRLEFDEGYTPDVGDSFVLMTYASKTGSFAAFSAPCLELGRTVQILVFDTQVVANITDAIAGDTDCDCALTQNDVAALMLALLDPPAYLAAHAACDGFSAVDLNGDARVDGRDIPLFLEEYVPFPG